MDTPTTNEICRKMNDVRCDLGEGVEDIVQSTKTLTDWRYYVRTYPWWCLAGAAAVGYFVVPRRLEVMRPSAAVLEQLAKRNHLVVTSEPSPQAKGGIAGALATLLVGAAVRGIGHYVGENAGKLWTTVPNVPNTGGQHAKSGY